MAEAANTSDHRSEMTHSSQESSSELRSVMAEGYSLQSGFANLPRRPNYLPDLQGNLKDKVAEIDIVGNSFRVSLSDDFDFEVLKYDVVFDPPIQEDANDREKILQSVEGNINEHVGNHALDNARIYAWKPLDQPAEQEWEAVDNIRIQYDVDAETNEPKFVELRAGQRNQLREMDLQYQQQVLSVFLRELCRHAGFIRMGRNHYDPAAADRNVNMAGANVSSVLKMMDGYRMSLEYICRIDMSAGLINEIALTIDACSRVLDPRNVREVINDLEQQNKSKRQLEKALIGELRGRAVITDYNNKIYKINNVTFNTKPSEMTMRDPVDFEGSKEMTVTEFYKTKYNREVKDYLPAVLLAHDLAPRKRDAGRTRTLYLVPEFCRLTGYPPKIRKNHALMKKLARANKIPSDIRAEKVEECAKVLAELARDKNNPLVIVPKLMRIKGRIYGDAPICLRDTTKGVKKISISDLQKNWKSYGMFGQTKLDKGKWAMVGLKKKKLQKLYKAMKSQTSNMGKDVMEEPIYLEITNNNAKFWEKQLDECCRENKPQAIVAIVPCSKQPDMNEKQKADEIYSAIKRICSKDHGVPSQCVQSCNADTSHVQVGITRQLYTKLGSLPWKLKFCLFGNRINLRKPTMLIGIDVNHDRKEAQSPVAFVSTWDRDFVRVHSQLGYHKLADEVLNTEEMSQFMQNAMNHFKEKNRRYPQQVIVYRDGIASTQIEHVQKNELSGIKQAFDSLGLKEKKDVKLEYILVNKRVNSRFVEAETKMNVPKGVIVDDQVVSSQYWDFYIVPADAPEGCTSTPTRFIIIRDDLALSQKKGTVEIEAFTKQLCNLYYNWPGPVRVPNIVKNADKLTTQFGSAVNGDVPHHLLQDTYHFL